MQEITSDSVSRMVDSTSAYLIAELDRQSKRWRALPIALLASVILIGAVASTGAGPVVLLMLAVPLIIASVAAHYWDLLKKSVVIMYDLDDDARTAFSELNDAVDALGRAAGLWHINARGDVHDPKYHAGAGHLVRRKGIAIREREPPFVRTNIAIHHVPTATGSLYFTPDTILYYTRDGVGAVSYENLRLAVGATRFIEEGSVPRDARIVDQTWRYVNKKGGPDRRFKDNRELPVCEYEEVHLGSSSGLNELFQVSRTGLGEGVRRAVERMAGVLTSARQASVNPASNRPPLEISKPQPVSARPPQTANSTTPLSEAASRPSFQQSVPTIAELHEALFRILCCVMVSDGRASSAEKARIAELMAKSGAHWDPQSVAGKIAEFIEEVQVSGFKSTLATTLARVPIFCVAGRPEVLLKCIDSLAAADGVAPGAERHLVELIRQKLNEEGVPAKEAAHRFPESQ
jgi:hypothetical protein